MNAIDLFAGAGGTTTGAKNAGVSVVWAANHDPLAVNYHALNHPEVEHNCQDLQQANWEDVPNHSLVLASPCCQGHSVASGKKKHSKKADKSRSTAWAIISCLEAHRSPICIIENVADFLAWELYKPWAEAMKTLGYSLSINHINAADVGVPQNRPRLFIIATRSKNPISVCIDKQEHVPASSFIDLDETPYKWDFIRNRVEATQLRARNGRAQFGNIYLDAAYGSSRTGRDINKPIGSILTVNKHSLIIGDKIRPLSLREIAEAQSFSDDYIWPKGAVDTKRMIGNAVPPLLAEKVISAVLKAA